MATDPLIPVLQGHLRRSGEEIDKLRALLVRVRDHLRDWEHHDPTVCRRFGVFECSCPAGSLERDVEDACRG